MPWFAILRGLTTKHERKAHGMEQMELSRKNFRDTRFPLFSNAWKNGTKSFQSSENHRFPFQWLEYTFLMG